MTTIFQPRATSGDVIRRALALDLDQDGHILRCLSIPLIKRLQKLQPIRIGIHSDLHAGPVYRRRLEGILTRVITSGRELKSGGWRKLERSTGGCWQRVSERIEREGATERESRDKIGRGNKCVRCRVGVIAAGKVAVVGGDDRVGFTLLHVLAIPLTDKGTAGVGKDDTTSFLKCTDLTIALNGSTDLLRTGRDREFRLEGKTGFFGLADEVGGAGHVLI